MGKEGRESRGPLKALLGAENVYTRKEVPKVQGGTKLKAEDREAKFSWRAWRKP